MKICPKCGQEYDGDSCPRCTGPEIIVNNNEYLQRRKAYEEKQAKKESASSSDLDAAKDAPDLEEVFTKMKHTGTVAVKKVQEISKKSGKKEKQDSDRVHRQRNKHIVYGVILVVVMFVITAATYGIYQLVTRKNYTLFMSYNNKIYDAASLDSTFVCNLEDAVFAADQKTFYKAEWPDTIDKAHLAESCVSQNGEYFAAVTYDEASLQYSLYVWNKDGCMEIATSRNQKNIKTVTDDGIVIYTDTEVVNLEGYTGTTTLYVCTTQRDKSQNQGAQLKGTIAKVEGNLMSAYVYSHKDTIICYTTGNRLYTYNYKKNVKSSVITSVDAVYPMSSDTVGYYAAQSGDENLFSEAEGYIYQANEIFYYTNLAQDTQITIGKVSGTNISFIYEKKNSCFYVISSRKLQYAQVKENAAEKLQEVDSLGLLQNMIYMSDDSSLIYVNEENQLMSINKGVAKLLKNQVKDGSLTRVGNTDDGITYITENTQYYRSGVSAAEVSVYSESGLNSTTDTYLYKNHLYFYNNAKELYYCTQKGKDVNKIGQVDSLWLGTEWK